MVKPGVNENARKRGVPCGQSTTVAFVYIEPTASNDMFRDTEGAELGQGDEEEQWKALTQAHLQHRDSSYDQRINDRFTTFPSKILSNGVVRPNTRPTHVALISCCSGMRSDVEGARIQRPQAGHETPTLVCTQITGQICEG